MKALKSLLCIVLCLLMLAGCGGNSGTSDSGKSKGTIKLGGLAPLTGNYAEYGKGFQIGFNKAIEEINANGGANGYQLEIEVKDSQGDPVTSTTLCTDFAEDEEIMAILGDFTSGACKADAPIVDENGVVLLSPTASAPDYASMSKYCFGIMGLQSGEAPYLAKYVLSKYLGAKKVAVIRIDSDWGKSCIDNFLPAAEEAGIEVVVDTYANGEKDFSSLITKMRATNPDVLVVMDQGDAVAQVFNQADAAGWTIQHVALGPGTSEQVAEQLTDKNNLIVTSPFFFDPANAKLKAWSDWFKEEAGFAPTIHPACAYDCVYLIAEAIKNIGDGEVTRDAIQEQLANLPAYEGITGTIKFTENGDIVRNYMICGVENGEWTVVKGFDYSQE